ncbi:DUF1348 family protein [uncultured Ferrovibrio sp.]|jgi:Uncharacterized protein conserved in bacteria|uniref:DUF1348 family protein n=1 Tax=uncultured Ferrovibrio sp. TaxID=1576913 RepID=UPI0026270A73|nr:DUF1348 family protein [uncultured Ferrovibrio sp.]
MSSRLPLPPYTYETAVQKVRSAENAWNTRDPHILSLAFSPECRWFSRSGALLGRKAIEEHLARKWAVELEYRVAMELWAFMDNQIAVRIAYECHDVDGVWSRYIGHSSWGFDPKGLIAERYSSFNIEAISEEQRLFRWPLGVRPEGYPGLKELGL